MGRTSIPVDEATKDRLDKLKRDDETWDEFLERTALSEDPIETGFLSDEGADEARKNIEKTRESF
jgi:hypothetical protein